MSCPDELTLSIYADGELATAEARGVADHLQACADCGALLASLQQENLVLKAALGEEEAVALSWHAGARARVATRSASAWVWGAIAAAALAPFLVDFVWQATPSLPVGLGWLGRFGGLSGVYSLSSGLMSFIVGGQDMLVSSFGFVATLFVVVGMLGALAFRRPPLAGAAAAMALGLMVGLAPPSSAHAAEFRIEEEGTVKVDSGETIDDTVFLGGKTAIVAGVVDGDVFAGAERVEVTGTVRGNVYSAGESVSISGNVGGNVHAAGKNVEVDTKVGGTGFLAGQNVTVTEDSELARGGFLAGETVRSKGRVGRDLHFAGEKVELGGNVERNARGYGRQISVSSGGSVGGDLHVTVPEEGALEVDDGATIGGETTIEIDEEHEHRAFMYPGFYLGVLAKTLAALLFGVLLVTLFPSLRPTAPESSREILRDMGIGFVALVATPVAAVIIALTIIGIPISIMLGVLYALLLFLSTLVVAYFAGERLPFGADSSTGVALRTGVALLVIYFAMEIPFVGGGLHFVVHIFGIGVLLMHARDLYLARRDAAAPVPA
jgi:anti-sigma factor RsiW